MKVRIYTYPRLGELTRVTAVTQSIVAVLEVPFHFADEKWQTTVWHSIDGNDWTHLDLQPLPTGDGSADLAQPATFARLQFRGLVSFTKSVQFTVKFRYGEDEPWIWANQEYGLQDGYLISASAVTVSEKLEDLIPNLGADWSISSLRSQAPETKLWSLTTKISPSKADESSFKDVILGTPFARFQKWFALVRTGTPWLAPRAGGECFALDKDGILCSFASGDGRHLALLAVSGVDDILSLFRSTDSNSVSVHIRNDASVKREAMVLVSESHDVDKAIASVVYHARSLIWKYSQTSNPKRQVLETGDIEPKWRENWYDGLGYCTWNSLGQDLSQARILNALELLKDNNINIANLIIDDNWQSIDASNGGPTQPGWVDFEANTSRFPNGLRGAVSQIRKQHRNIEHIFVWHALLGYWGGISPGGKIAKRYKTREVRRQDDGSTMTVVSQDDISRLYDDFYSFLIQSGVDGVKTDAQCMLDTIASASARRELTNAYLDKWSIASLRHFGTTAISCMSQFPQALFHAFMPQIRPALVVRNSDDYFPNVPSSHRWHVWANAHNSIFTQYLNVVPDWDMFQTAHEFADFHAAARCLSGGPIYITDIPGQHNIKLLHQFTATTTLGKTVSLRPSVVGIAMDPYQNYDSGELLRIGSFHGSSSGGVSLLGVFQTSDARNSSLIPLHAFRGVSASTSYVVRAFTTGAVSKQLHLEDKVAASILATPSDKGYEIYSAYEVQSFASLHFGDMGVANLGLVDKMTGCAAVEASDIIKDSKISVKMKLKALGVLGVYISSLAHMTIDDNFMVSIFGHPVPRRTVRVSSACKTVLEVDVQTAWRELGLDSGWSNEVEVTVNILGV